MGPGRNDLLRLIENNRRVLSDIFNTSLRLIDNRFWIINRIQNLLGENTDAVTTDGLNPPWPTGFPSRMSIRDLTGGVIANLIPDFRRANLMWT